MQRADDPSFIEGDTVFEPVGDLMFCRRGNECRVMRMATFTNYLHSGMRALKAWHAEHEEERVLPIGERARH